MIEYDIVIRGATKEDIEQLSQYPIPRTGYAWSVEYKGELVAIAGAYFEYKSAFCFSSSKKDIKCTNKQKWIVVKKLFNKILKESKGRTIYAFTDNELKTSPTLLKHLGFKEQEEGIWIWHKWPHLYCL
jgi:hypothetical protein